MTALDSPDPAPVWLRGVLWIFAALAAAWCLVSLWWPIGLDLGLYSWVGHVILNGGVQYRDAWDMHGPLVGYIMALGALLFGKSAMGLRVLDLIFLAIGCIGFVRIVRPLSGLEISRWGAILMVLAYSSFSHKWTMQPEGWMALVSMAVFAPALLALERGEQVAPRALILAAVAAGCFALIKPFYGLFVVVPLLAAWFAEVPANPAHKWLPPPRAVVRPLLILTAVSLAIVAVALAWFALHGTLGELLEVHIFYTGRVYGGTAALDIKYRIWNMLKFFQEEPVLSGALPLSLAGFVVLWRGGRKALVAACVAWLAIGVFCAQLQGKFYLYHWVPTMPPLLITFTVALAALFAEPRRSVARIIATTSLLVILAKAAEEPVMYVSHWTLYMLGVQSEQRYYGRFKDAQILAYHQRETARYLAATTQPHETFAVWGYDAGLFMQADRPTPFRLAGWFWAVTKGTQPVRDEYREEYLADFIRTRPRYMVVDIGTAINERPRSLQDFVALDSLLAREYQRDTVFGPLLLLRRQTP